MQFSNGYKVLNFPKGFEIMKQNVLVTLNGEIFNSISHFMATSKTFSA